MISKCKLALVLLVSIAARAQSNTWELGHPDAKLLIGIDLKSMRESAAGQLFRSQWDQQPQQGGPAATMALGFLEKIDRVFISSPSFSPAPRKLGKTVAAPTTPATAHKDNPPFLLAVEGTLPLQELLAFLPGTPQKYHGIDIYKGSKPGDANIATLDERNIIVGDEKSVLAAIDRRGKPLPAPAGILKRAQALSATHDFWMIAEDSLSKFQPSGTNFSSPLVDQFASKIKGVEMGLALHDGFQFELNLATESDAFAEQMAQMLGTQIAQAVQAQGNRPEAAEFVNKLRIESQGNRLHASIALTAEEFTREIQAAQAMRAAAGTRAAATSPEPAKPAKPATPGKIKIYGLDEGVREIQLSH